MSSTPDPISRLSIPPEKKSGRKGRSLLPVWIIALILIALIGWLKFRNPTPTTHPSASPGTNETVQPLAAPPPVSDNSVSLTASGHIVPRERIELTAKFPSTVQTFNVKKGDKVTRGQVLVQMVDSTFKAKVAEAKGRLALAQAHKAHAATNYARQLNLNKTESSTAQELDDARQALDVAKAEIQIAEGQLSLAETHLSWCAIRSPINGTVLAKLAEPDELIIPQGYGGIDRPVTTLLALADLTDLQIEVDVNELDTPKVQLGQRCNISPEAYADKVYEGEVVEIAPEADRIKGTLQVKVQVKSPDKFLVPDLNAKVEFLK